MLEIRNFKCNNTETVSFSDNSRPSFSFIIESSDRKAKIKSAYISLLDWKKDVKDLTHCIYDGKSLKPFSQYEVTLEVVDENNLTYQKKLILETGFMDLSWNGKWISDGSYHFKEKKSDPKVMVFSRDLVISKKLVAAKVYATALGIYNLNINNQKVGNAYFAPGFTSYENNLQYQIYDIKNLLTNNSNNITFIVAGGWAIGSFTMTRKNKISAPRQALLAEIHLTYSDGSKEVITTDQSWGVSLSSLYLETSFYDGEIFDANIDLKKVEFHSASLEKIKINPRISVQYGPKVVRHEKLKPKFIGKDDQGRLIFDFRQNFAGIVKLNITKANKNQLITVRHAEVLEENNRLNVALLRTAKAQIRYICKEGPQVYSPEFTYMGFRYISVEGIDAKDFKISAYVLYSEIEQVGRFECSNKLLNRLQENIIWSAKSNFVEIPTDCPQRDERMGWTGDISIFSETACFNFDMESFLDKWLIDLRSEQLKSGGIPNTIPTQGYGFPTTMPVLAVEFWGDASINVPLALYAKSGNKIYLEEAYQSMKKYVDACAFWARLGSVGQSRYIWNTLSTLHFGDWVAPDVNKMSAWQKRSKYTATASLKNTSYQLAKIAKLLKKDEDFIYYYNLAEKVSEAYENKLLSKDGKIKDEFQTGYVLPLYFKMLSPKIKEVVLKNLISLVRKNNYCIGTGFPGTPYILFALTDNGYFDEAMKMLLNTKCPSWLYAVKVGGTTIWEKYDGLDEDGKCVLKEDGTGGMISFNHYASGAVGDFLYKRLAGIEKISAGYQKFKIEPKISTELSYVKASTLTPYGEIAMAYQIEGNEFKIKVKVPLRSQCQLVLPSKEVIELECGEYEIKEILLEEKNYE